MYLYAKILFIIFFSYECKTIYANDDYDFSSEFGLERHMGVDKNENTVLIDDGTGNKDCVLWAPEKPGRVMPVILENTKEGKPFEKDEEGRVHIKHHAYFKLSCKNRFFGLTEMRYEKEIVVQCVKGDSLIYDGHIYMFEDFECATRKRPTEKPVTLKPPEIKDKGENSCFIFLGNLLDYNIPIPIRINPKNNKAKIMRSDRSGIMSLKRDEVFKMACTGKKNAFISPFPYEKLISEVTLTCLNGSYVKYNNQTFDFEHFQCKEVPKAELMVTPRMCHDDSSTKVAVVGFKISGSFLNLYKICFDEVHQIPIYTWYFVEEPLYRRPRNTTEEPEFYKPDKELFGNTDVAAIYKNQTEILGEIINSTKLANWYIKLSEGMRYIKPGLLTAENEFNYAFEQRATYFYENSAPQWFIFHEGVWKDLERLFRRNLQRNTCYKRLIITGTYGTSDVYDMNVKSHDIHLKPPESMTVPLYIWKLEYDLLKRKGVVWVGMNNPYRQIDKTVYICDVIPCPGSLRRTSFFSKELLYCCDFRSFQKAFGELDPYTFREFY